MRKRNSYFLLFPFHKRKSMFAVLHSDINLSTCLSLASFILTGQPYCKKSRSSKVKDGIINLFLISDRYKCCSANFHTQSTNSAEARPHRTSLATSSFQVTISALFLHCYSAKIVSIHTNLVLVYLQ